MRIFQVDGKIYMFLDMFWNVVKLNFMWIIFSLPIVTIGASTVAAYSVTLKMIDNEEGHVVRQFIKAFKDNWKQGIPLGAIGIGISYLAYLNFEFFDKAESNPILFLLAGIVIVFFGILYLTYAFPLCARHQNSLLMTLKNSAAISVKYFLRTVILWIIILALIVLFLFNTTLIFIGILIGPVSIFLTVSGFAIRFFKEIDKDNNCVE